MAIGDQQDFVGRIKAVLPLNWFRGDTPVLDAILSGYAWSLSFIYALLQFVKLQMRLATATDGFLDLISFDFFGNNLLRRIQETDAAFRARILNTILREKATRAGMIVALTNLTGRVPKIFEPARPLDTGAYDVSTSGYGVAGGYGSLVLNAQVFITAFRPTSSGIPNVAGYGSTSSGYNDASQGEWATLAQVKGAATDSDIYAIIAATAAAGTEPWVQILS